MNPTQNQEVVTEPKAGEEVVESDTVTIPKKDYESLNQTLGSLKREIKDLKKSKDEPKEISQPQSQADSSSLLEKAYLRTAGITDPDEVEEALRTAKKWGVTVDKLVEDDDFKVKLDKLRTTKSNAIATSGIKGDKGTVQAKNDPQYWINSGKVPTPTDVPDRKTRAKIARAFMSNAKGGKKFYNEQ